MAENTAEKAYQLGKKYEKTRGGCSQCVIAALQDVFDIRNDDIFKAAIGLAGGGGLATDGSCGAYAGATLVMCFLQGRERDDFENLTEPHVRPSELETLERVRKLRDKFIQEYGSIICRNIQTKILGRPYYLADMYDFEKFIKAGAHDIHCPEVVGKAARWAAELIIEDKLT